MPGDINALIRVRAYEIWEAEGRPHGRDREHWYLAASEIAVEVAPMPEPTALRSKAPTTAAKVPTTAIPSPAKKVEASVAATKVQAPVAAKKVEAPAPARSKAAAPAVAPARKKT